ncbi:MAG: methyltransferase domain-containing protein [Planctomycetota bacterium]
MTTRASTAAAPRRKGILRSELTAMALRYAEYAKRGDYHQELDPNWAYYPVYVPKMEFIRKFLYERPPSAKILDLGCGEGVLVREMRGKGYDMTGADPNYESDFVIRSSIADVNLESGSYDAIICSDVLEHLNVDEQEEAIRKMHGLLKPRGALLITVPNLAHFSSRLCFLLTGRPLRTSTIERHKGERPIREFIDVLEKYFYISKRQGLFPTFPLSLLLTYLFPGKVLPLHRLLNALFAYPNWCFLNLFICERREKSPPTRQVCEYVRFS